MFANSRYSSKCVSVSDEGPLGALDHFAGCQRHDHDVVGLQFFVIDARRLDRHHAAAAISFAVDSTGIAPGQHDQAGLTSPVYVPARALEILKWHGVDEW